MNVAMWTLAALAVAGTIGLIAGKYPRCQPEELMRLGESPATGMLGLLLWAFGLWFCSYRVSHPAGQQAEALFILAMSMGLGAAALLLWANKKAILLPQGVLVTGVFGGRQFFPWEKVEKMKMSGGRLMLLDPDGNQCSINGTRQQLRGLIELAAPQLRPGVQPPQIF